eukprot:gene10020-7162_t
MGNGELSKSFYPDSPLFSSSEVAIKASKSSSSTSSEHKPDTIARWYYKCAACWVPRNLYKLEAEARRGSKLARCFLARMHVYDATFIKKDADKAALLVEGLVPWLQVESSADDSASHIYAVYLLATCYAKGIGVEQNTQTAYQLYSTAALEGYHCAQNALAKCYKQGFGIETDIHQSMKWFSMAAEAGHAEAQYNLAYCYEHGIGVEASNDLALHYYRLSAEQGNAHALYSLEKGLAEAQYIVGLSYDMGNEDDDDDDEEDTEEVGAGTEDTDTAHQTPKKGSSLINESYFLTTPQAQYHTPVKQALLDAQTANASAVKSMIFSPAEKQRYLPAESPANLQHISLLAYFSPTHTSTPLLSTTTTAALPPLPTVAAGSSTHGSATARVLPNPPPLPPLAPSGREVLLYTSPNPQYQQSTTTTDTAVPSTRFHVRRNPTEAFRWYLMAAEQGHAGAQCNVGYAYMTEEGLPDDLRQTYLTRSATMSHCTVTVTVKKEAGEGGGDGDDEETQYQRWREAQAVYWYQASAAQEHDEGQYNLGVCYRHGDGGLSVSFAEAMRWFALAAKQGNCKAQYELGKGYRHLHYLSQRLRWRQRMHPQPQPQPKLPSPPSTETLLGIPTTTTVDWPNDSFIQWQLSAQQGFVPAMTALSESYEYGFGVRKSSLEARKWCLLACGVDEAWIQQRQRTETITVEVLQDLDLTATVTEEQGEAFFRLACAYLPELAGDTDSSTTAAVTVTQPQPPAPLVKKKSSVALTTTTGGSGATSRNPYARRLNVSDASRSVAWTAMWCAAHAGHALARGYVAQHLWEPQVLRPLYRPSSPTTAVAAVSVYLAVDAVEQLWQSYLPLVQEVLHALETRRRRLSSSEASAALPTTAEPTTATAVVHSRGAESEAVVGSPAQVMALCERGERVLFTQLLSSWDAPATFPWKSSGGDNAAANTAAAAVATLVSSWQAEAVEAEEEKELLWWLDAMEEDATARSNSGGGSGGSGSGGGGSGGVTGGAAQPPSGTHSSPRSRDVYALKRDVYAHAAYMIARQCERYLHSQSDTDAVADADVDGNVDMTIGDGAAEDGDALAAVEQRLRDGAGAFLASQSLYPASAETTTTTTAAQWSVVYTLYHFAAVAANHSRAQHRLASLLMEQMVADRLSLATLYTLVAQPEAAATSAAFAAGSPAYAWWRLVVHAAQQVSSPVSSPAPSTIWELFGWRDALRTMALRWWHPLAVTAAASTGVEAPSSYASWIAAYRVGLVYEAWAQELKTVAELPSLQPRGHDESDEPDAAEDDDAAMAATSHEVLPALPRFTTTELDTTATAPTAAAIDDETGATRLWAQYLFHRCVSNDAADDDDAVLSRSLFRHPASTANVTATATAMASPPRSPLRRTASSSLVSLPSAAVSPSSASSSAKSATTALSWTVVKPWTNDGRYVDAVQRLVERWSRQCQQQSIWFFYHAASGGAVGSASAVVPVAEVTSPVAARRGYYLAQYALAWSCEEHLAAVLYGSGAVGQERQAAAAVRWYEAVAERASAVIAALHPPPPQPPQPPHSDERTTAAGLASCWQLDDQAEEWLVDVFPVDWLETVSDACYAIAQAWQSDHAPSGRSSSSGEVSSGVGGGGGGLREAIRWYERAIAVAEAASERPVLPQLKALSVTAEASSGNGKGKPIQPQAATAAAAAAAAGDGDEAIEPGHAEALYQLGCIYLYGDTAQGIPQQLQPGRCLLEASARCGHEEARQLISLSSAVATR